MPDKPRIQKACNSCSRSKLRCVGVEFEDGKPVADANGQIACRRCLRAGRPCTFDRPPKKRAPKVDLVKTLQQRIRDLEAQFQVPKEESKGSSEADSSDTEESLEGREVLAREPLSRMVSDVSETGKPASFVPSVSTVSAGPWRPGHEPREALIPDGLSSLRTTSELWNILHTETEMMDWDAPQVMATLAGPTGQPLHEDVFLAGGFDQPNPMLQSGMDNDQLEVLFQQFIAQNAEAELVESPPSQTGSQSEHSMTRLHRTGSIHNPQSLPMEMLAKHEASDPYFFLPDEKTIERLFNTYAGYNIPGSIRTAPRLHFVKTIRSQPNHLIAAIFAAASLIEGTDQDGNPPTVFDPAAKCREIGPDPPAVSSQFRFFYDCCLFLLNRSLLFRPTQATIETLGILGFIRGSMASWRDALVPMTTMPGLVAVLGLDRDPDLKRKRQRPSPSPTPSTPSEQDRRKTMLESRIDALHESATQVPSGPPVLAPPSDWLEHERSRRIYWYAFSHDNLRAFYSGRRPMIHDDDCRVSLPAPDHLWDMADKEPEKAPHRTPFVYWVDPDGAKFPRVPSILAAQSSAGPFGPSAMTPLLWRIFIRINDFRSWQFERDFEIGKELTHEHDRELRHRLKYCEKALDDWFGALPPSVRKLCVASNKLDEEFFVDDLADIQYRGFWMILLLWYLSMRIHLFGNGELVSLFRGGHKVHESGWLSWKECMNAAQSGSLVLQRLGPGKFMELGPSMSLGLLQQAAVYLMTVNQAGEVGLSVEECRQRVGHFVSALEVLATRYTTCYNLAGILKGNLESALDGL
jgi:hypothetical protein